MVASIGCCGLRAGRRVGGQELGRHVPAKAAGSCSSQPPGQSSWTAPLGSRGSPSSSSLPAYPARAAISGSERRGAHPRRRRPATSLAVGGPSRSGQHRGDPLRQARRAPSAAGPAARAIAVASAIVRRMASASSCACLRGGLGQHRRHPLERPRQVASRIGSTGRLRLLRAAQRSCAAAMRASSPSSNASGRCRRRSPSLPPCRRPAAKLRRLPGLAARRRPSRRGRRVSKPAHLLCRRPGRSRRRPRAPWPC